VVGSALVEEVDGALAENRPAVPGVLDEGEGLAGAVRRCAARGSEER
jgi:hypothetical protein